MKKLLLIAGISTLSLMACKQRSQTGLETSKDLIILTDSSKSYLSDTGVVSSGAERSGTLATPVAPAPAPKRSVSSKTYTRSSSSSGSGSGQSSAGTGSSSNTGTAQAPQAQKQGMSKAAKGAIIGGVGGAAAGAVIGKNAKGAVIGGAVGAAGGYIIGRSKDRKDGRVQ